MPNEAPAIAVVVPTRGRPLRLRWLLNALHEQEIAEPFEVLVAWDGDPASGVVLGGHPLAGAGALRAIRMREGAGPAEKRNAAWRAARAPVVAFTDDDCRPPAGWLAALLTAARAHPDAIVQGATTPDPDELAVFHRAPHARSQQIAPPHPMAQTCNIAYPRALLERLGGFDESYADVAGEDVDLALRAQAAGAPLVAAPAALTHHAVEWGLRRRLRGSWRWRHMARVVREHPELRRELPLRGYAWSPRHAPLALALGGALLARRAPLAAAALALPYALSTPRTYGSGPRALARTAAELPGRALVDGAQLAALLAGSIEQRTLLI